MGAPGDPASPAPLALDGDGWKLDHDARTLHWTGQTADQITGALLTIDLAQNARCVGNLFGGPSDAATMEERVVVSEQVGVGGAALGEKSSTIQSEGEVSAGQTDLVVLFGPWVGDAEQERVQGFTFTCDHAFALVHVAEVTEGQLWSQGGPAGQAAAASFEATISAIGEEALLIQHWGPGASGTLTYRPVGGEPTTLEGPANAEGWPEMQRARIPSSTYDVEVEHEGGFVTGALVGLRTVVP